jgi:hypothetical protein
MSEQILKVLAIGFCALEALPLSMHVGIGISAVSC